MMLDETFEERFMTRSARMAVIALSFVALVAAAGTAGAQTYPVRPIRLLASGVGGGGDFTARLIAPALTTRLGQQVVVDNRPGGLIPGEILSQAPPDGHTLMLVGIVIWLSPFMRDTMPFDPVRDFTPVALAVTTPNVLVVHPAVGVKSVQQLITLARQRPGQLNYATSGVGNSNHIAGELFKSMAGVNLVRVNYRGAAFALNDVVGGRVELMFATANAANPHVSSGRLIGLGVTSARPSPLAPGLPAVAESGLPGYESAATLGVLARAGTPSAIVNRLNREIVEFLSAPETKERFLKAGIEVVGSTPAEFAAVIKDDMARKGKIIRAAGIRME
jgi:tripartite-type tricarboxylate transporter receptor subunit TctC